jgi:serine protease AprX
MSYKFPKVPKSVLKLAAVIAILATLGPGLHGANGHRAHLSDDLVAFAAHHGSARARIIVQGSDEEVDALADRHHLQIIRRLADGAVIAASPAEVSELAADAAVDHLSGDVPVHTSMSVSNLSTAADQVRAGSPGLLGIAAIAGVTGQGIGVAVIDSGISSHAALSKKVVANVSLITGDSSTADAFGHGTHVAGVIAGNGAAGLNVTPLYTGGIAPGAQLINVRVLGGTGMGLTSDVIAGIDWAVANRSKYNIRIINLSLGHPVFEPAATDPLCKAVARAVQAGVVVVAAAGNYGFDPSTGQMILGGITSPGNSPFALTVGAVNTSGTVGRSDDTVATYSSRGPTRYDLAVKPDVAAPGNKIISLEASKSYLASNYPFLHKAGTGTNAYMQLSGTSMAAPMVSGAAALLLSGTPGLSPAQVKLAIQAGATYMAEGGLMGAGTGNANFWASRKIAASGLTGSLLNTTIGGLSNTSSGASFWDAGKLSSRLYAGVGIRLLSALEAPLVWLSPSLLNYGDLNLVGLTNPLASMLPVRLQYGVVSTWTSNQQILWGTSIRDPQGQQILWGTSDTTQGTQILWGTSVAAADPQ